MIYLSPQTSRLASLPERWGQLHTPQSWGCYVRPGIKWAADNGQFSGRVTVDKYRFYAWRIKALGYPVALVGQDGLESLPWPPEYDAFFVGGSTEWKMSDAADWCIAKAKASGAWVHVGRVNSQRRIRHFQLVGVDSCDGTALAFAPNERMRELNTAIQQPPLFEMEINL